jgi:hypothetical protein
MIKHLLAEIRTNREEMKFDKEEVVAKMGFEMKDANNEKNEALQENIWTNQELHKHNLPIVWRNFKLFG